MPEQRLWGYESNCTRCGRPIHRMRGGGMWVHQNTGLYECDVIKYAYPMSSIKEVWIDASK